MMKREKVDHRQSGDSHPKEAESVQSVDADIETLLRVQRRLRAQASGTAPDAPPELWGGSGPKPGTTGVIKRPQPVQIDGQAIVLPPGTVVVAQDSQSGVLRASVYSGIGNGKTAVLPLSNFQPEPGLAHLDDRLGKSYLPDHSYRDYAGVLWHDAPKVEDVAQGALSDCYFVAAMIAVCAADPLSISACFLDQNLDNKRVRIRLFRRNPKGQLEPRVQIVDELLPTAAGNSSPAYADVRQKGGPKGERTLWPALLEKAYAQMLGGYDKMADDGGQASDAMESLTGRSSQVTRAATAPGRLLADLRTYEQEGSAVVFGTKESVPRQGRDGFRRGDDGGYTAILAGVRAGSAEIFPGSLHIVDRKNKAPVINDDGVGGLTAVGARGAAHGSVDYRSAAVTVFYAQDEPQDAADLVANFRDDGVLDGDDNVFADHSYVFAGVTPDGKIKLLNPWGDQHPNPIAPEKFHTLFDRDAEINPKQ